MLDLFADLETGLDVDERYSRAKSLSRREPRAAAKELCAALMQTHARDESYLRVANLLCEVFQQLAQPRAALSVAWYAMDARTEERLLADVLPIDRARTLAAWAEKQPARQKELFSRAAAELEQAGLLVRAAIYYERAEQQASARTLWARLSQLLDARGAEPYAAGLASFNLARMSLLERDERAAREATVTAVHRLEEAADRFETVGQRERAFDCYHVMVAIGELTKTFEHVLEGSVNAIRILSEDNLRYHALRLYKHAIDVAREANETAAAATLAREMTVYARKQNLPRVAAESTRMQAGLWLAVAERIIERGQPAHLAENAFIASLLAHAEAGQYPQVGQLYRRLQTLEIDPARREHYGRAAKRYDNVSSNEESLDQEQLGAHVPPPDLWHVDLIEWEEHGSAAEACADVVLDSEELGDRITRRSALVGRLVALFAEQAKDHERSKADALLANHLKPIGLYVLLPSLEALYESRDREVRLAAIRSIGRYYYKRTFITLERALRDSDAAVRVEAANAVEKLKFDHAFDPLARIYQTTSQPGARIAALKALSRIDIVEAAELCLGALDHGGPEERKAAIAALAGARGARFVEAARAAYPHGSLRLKSGIKEVFTGRGLPI